MSGIMISNDNGLVNKNLSTDSISLNNFNPEKKYSSEVVNFYYRMNVFFL